MQKIQNKTECFLIFYCKRTLVAGAKLANVYVLFCVKNSLFFDLYQFYYYFCTQKEKLIFKDTNHNYIKNTTAETFKNFKSLDVMSGLLVFVLFHFSFFLFPFSLFR